MGVLKMLGEFWPAGKREYKAVGVIARTILGLREEEVRVPEDVGEVGLLSFDGMEWGGGEEGFLGCDDGFGGVEAYFNDAALLI